MHIVLVISSLTAGGAEHVLSELANAWSVRGHEVSIITLADPNVPPFYRLNDQIHLYQLNALQRENCFFLQRLKNIMIRILKLRGSLKLEKPDVIISFIDVMNITTLLANAWLKIPVIVCERIDPHYHKLPLFYEILRRLTYPWANKVISQTLSASNYFVTLPGGKKAIIPNQVVKSPYLKRQQDILKPVKQITSVGRLCLQKDFITLILAFSRIAVLNQDLRLTIYGEGPERQNLEKLIQELDLISQISLPGTVKDIGAVLYQSDLFVFPSHYEGFPNALCEAMAIGLPVIASNCSGSIDIIREGIDGRLFGVGDVVQLTKLMEELIEDAPQRLRLSEGALGLSDRFSQEAILQMWDEVLVEAVRSPNS